MRTFFQRMGRGLDRIERLLEAQSTRLVLSCLIIVSVLPSRVHAAFLPAAGERFLDPLFLVVFSIEFCCRLALYARRWRQRRATGGEPLLLFLDLLAILSFLPLHTIVEARYLRALRLTRLLLIVGYWGPMARELWDILRGPERRYQVLLVLFLGLFLSFGGAVLLFDLTPNYDFDADGDVDPQDHDFHRVLWWTFRQVQDSGNLVPTPGNGFIVLLSLVLTFAGLLLLSFIIGIGTNVVEELVRRSRSLPVGKRDHTVILGLSPNSRILLEGLAEIYRKNLRPFRAAVLGHFHEAPDYFHQSLLRAFEYRAGDPVQASHLDRVNVQHAKRVLVLASDPRNPDAEVIAAVLATRERNPEVHLYPDLEHERSFSATRAAGGRRTHVVGSGSFLGYYLAQNVVYPGVSLIYEQMLRSSGCEIYTYIFSAAEREKLVLAGAPSDPSALYSYAFINHHVTLLGLFAALDTPGELEVEDLELVLNPVRRARQGAGSCLFDGAGSLRWPAIHGLVGIALRWEHLRTLAQALVAGATVCPAVPLPAAAFADLELRPPGEPVERVLICGESLRVPRVVMELVGFYRRLEITLLVRARERCRVLARDVAEMLERALGTPLELREEAEVFHLRVTTADGAAEIRIREGDWQDLRRPAAEDEVDVETADAFLLLPAASASDELDGNVALDCLHLANLARQGAVRLRSGLRVVAMVRDPVKCELLESRLQQISGAGGPRFDVVASERVRHDYIVQNVFVRGLNAIFLSLLSFDGEHLGRFLPVSTAGAALQGTFGPWDLARHLLYVRGLVLVGIEHVLPGSDGEIEVLLDPSQLPRQRLDWANVRALYLLREGQGPLVGG